MELKNLMIRKYYEINSRWPEWIVSIVVGILTESICLGLSIVGIAFLFRIQSYYTLEEPITKNIIEKSYNRSDCIEKYNELREKGFQNQHSNE